MMILDSGLLLWATLYVNIAVKTKCTLSRQSGSLLQLCQKIISVLKK